MKQATDPLAPTYSVVADVSILPVETGDKIVSDAPSLVTTPDGALLCAAPQGHIVYSGQERSRLGLLLFYRSDDGGQSWSKLPVESTFHCGTLIPQGETLYFLGAGPYRGAGILIIRSDDAGETWSEPTELFAGGFYNAASSYVVREGYLYWCFGSVNKEGLFNSKGSRTVVVAADFSKDLTECSAWRISDYLTYPGTPASLRRGLADSPEAPYHDHWLEGNVVEVQGQLRVCWRTRIDGYCTAGVAAICDLDDDGEQLNYRFSHFYPWPGAQNHFHMIHDEVSDLWWMTTNLPTRSQDMRLAARLEQDQNFKGWPGNERRILALYCSFDALNWLPAGYVTVWPRLSQASNYCGLLIDGDDLLVASRTAASKADNQHDNDLVTFHRVNNFRTLAEPLMPAQ